LWQARQYSGQRVVLTGRLFEEKDLPRMDANEIANERGASFG
jgi:hypothetical protein